MAKESLNAQKNNVAPPSGGSLGVEYQIGKNKFHRINYSQQIDVVFDRYKVETKKPLQQFDSLMAKAYQVADLQNHDIDSYYAVVLDKRYPARLAEINKLLTGKMPNFANVIAAQILPLSLGTGQFFTVILQKPHGIKLSEFLASNGPVNEDALVNKIIKPICNVIGFFEKENITHGNINLKNVYIDKSGTITLGECVSQICGVSQSILYEDIARSSTSTFAKGCGKSGSVDYHALGVMSVLCLRGQNFSENISDKALLHLKYTKNTYKIITEGIEISPYMLDFIRGSVNDQTKNTWDNKRVTEWLGGRKYNLLPPTDNIDAGRPILFNGKKFLSKQHLAYAMFEDWDEAKHFIKESTLIRWIERSVQDVALSEKMELLSHRSGGGQAGSSFDREDELLAQYILLLDPKGPIRLKQVSVSTDGIGTLLAHAYATSNTDLIDAVHNIVKYSLTSYKETEQDYSDKLNLEKEMVFRIKRCTELLRKKYIGFGLERCLYELNPQLACQSEILKNSYSCVIQEALLSLEKTPITNNEILDIHLSSFLSAKLELPTKIRITPLNKFQDFASTPAIQNLALLSLAQQRFGGTVLPNLAQNVVTSLNDSIETFHSRFIREEITNQLESVIKTGNLTKILSIISNTSFLVRDRLGFRRAILAYKNNSIQLIKLNNKKSLNNMGYLYGLQLSVISTFFIATVVVIVLILKIF
jgi:hypothetical protein